MAAFVKEVKESRPCADCRNFFPHYVMDFDHRDASQKTAIVSRLVNHLSWRRLREEIAKCDLVCSNCHRIRTQERLRSQIGAKNSGSQKITNDFNAVP
jgi:hypothetical protein